MSWSELGVDELITELERVSDALRDSSPYDVEHRVDLFERAYELGRIIKARYRALGKRFTAVEVPTDV